MRKDLWEYYWNGKWIVCRDVKLRRRSDYKQLFLRKTEHFEYGKRKSYYLNNVLHRLDGPAQTYSGFEYWYVNGKYLLGFNIYFRQFYLSTQRKIKKLIFDYAKEYPEYINEIILLAKFNNWLNKKDIELLSCMDMFIPN